MKSFKNKSICQLCRVFFFTLMLGTTGSLSASANESPTAKSTRPNILWISCEDISSNLGCYGDTYATTPNLDRFSKQGIRFLQCFGHAGVCAVNRSGIITGVYPTSIGSQHMRSRIVPPPYIKCFTEYLRKAGYYCTNRSKTDYNFESPLTAWDKNGRRHKDWKGRAKGQPFFSVINLTISHESKIRSKYDKLEHDPKKVKLPPYIPDTPLTRRDRARYYDIITKMDRQVGEILQRLKNDGLEENTVVIFWSDHGAGLPRAKRWLYDSGLQVPMIVRWPGTLKPNSVRDDLVCFIDLAPTVLSLAGIEAPRHMQGRSFLPYENVHRRKYIFAHRDRMDEAYDMIRAVRDHRYKYIRNFMPRRTYAQNIEYMNEMPTMKEMRRLYMAGKLKGAEKLYFRKTKPVEELYDLKNDPHEIDNIASNPKFSTVLKRMRKVLEDWQVETGDMGLIPEPILMESMRSHAKYAVAKPPQIRLEPHQTSTLVRLSCPTNGASIAYTMRKGKNRNWKLYSKSFRVKPGTTLRTKACRLGYRDSKTIVQTIGK